MSNRPFSWAICLKNCLGIYSAPLQQFVLISISESEFCRGVWNSSRLLTGTQNSVGKETEFSILIKFFWTSTLRIFKTKSWKILEIFQSFPSRKFLVSEKKWLGNSSRIQNPFLLCHRIVLLMMISQLK